MAVILITHDLGVVAEVADRVCVMYAGKIVEQSNIDDVYYRPDHPYTIGLLNSIPRVDLLGDRRLQAIPGQPPSLISLPPGCSFRPRCAHSKLVPNNRCATDVPNLDEKVTGHFSRCHLMESQLVQIRTSTGGQQ